MCSTDRFAAYRNILDGFAAEGRLRSLPKIRPSDIRIDLSSNDYLGLAKRQDEFLPLLVGGDNTPRFSASASRLLALDQDCFLALEERLAELYGKSVLLFNSGYHANVGITSALAVPGTLFLSDKLIHASAIDGMRRQGVETARWNHNDIAHLRRLVAKHYDSYDRLVIVAESVYSMDGDVAPLADLVALRRECDKVILYVDEAHGFGCFGQQGLGLAEELGLIDDIDIIVGTLGKAAASAGAFVATSPLLRDYLLNTARSFIFSTALPPVQAAWSLLMVNAIVGMTDERRRLCEISKRFRSAVESLTGVPNPSSSQIVPLLTGSAQRAVALSEALRSDGIIALPIRRPTVPPGGERIRFSLSADLSDQQLDEVISSLKFNYNRF